MKGKVLFALGVGVGYVLGSAAGRERYETLKEQAKSAWESPSVQEKVTVAEERIGSVVREQGAQVAEKISDTVKQTLGSQQQDDQTGDQQGAQGQQNGDPATGS